jgi:hypothetical protein
MFRNNLCSSSEAVLRRDRLETPTDIDRAGDVHFQLRRRNARRALEPMQSLSQC